MALSLLETESIDGRTDAEGESDVSLMGSPTGESVAWLRSTTLYSDDVAMHSASPKRRASRAPLGRGISYQCETRIRFKSRLRQIFTFFSEKQPTYPDDPPRISADLYEDDLLPFNDTQADETFSIGFLTLGIIHNHTRDTFNVRQDLGMDRLQVWELEEAQCRFGENRGN